MLVPVRTSFKTGRQAGRQAGRQTGRQADRQTGRQADRQAGRYVDRQAGRQAGSLNTVARYGLPRYNSKS